MNKLSTRITKPLIAGLLLLIPWKAFCEAPDFNLPIKRPRRAINSNSSLTPAAQFFKTKRKPKPTPRPIREYSEDGTVKVIQ